MINDEQFNNEGDCIVMHRQFAFIGGFCLRAIAFLPIFYTTADHRPPDAFSRREHCRVNESVIR